MAGLAPMMYGVSLNFAEGGYSVDSPTALWWKQLATAVVFGLGVATVLTLIFTPSMLALRVWAATIVSWLARALGRLGARRASQRAQDWALARAARHTRHPEILWEEPPAPAIMLAQPAADDTDAPDDETAPDDHAPLRAAE